MDQALARGALQSLVDSYARVQQVAERADGGYVEGQARVDFIDPFLALLGWDLRNEANRPHSTR